MKNLELPTPAPLMGRPAWSAFLLALIVVGVLAPVFNLWVPESSPFHLSDYAIALIGKIMCPSANCIQVLDLRVCAGAEFLSCCCATYAEKFLLVDLLSIQVGLSSFKQLQNQSCRKALLCHFGVNLTILDGIHHMQTKLVQALGRTRA